MGTPNGTPDQIVSSGGQVGQRLTHRPMDDETAASWHPATLMIVMICLFAILYLISRYNYSLFHALAEIFSITLVWSVSLLVFNARRFVASDSLTLLGTAYLFVGLIDLLHSLSYKGMGIFTGYDEANLSTQLWIAARYMESLSLLAFAAVLGRTVRLSMVAILYTIATPVGGRPDLFLAGISRLLCYRYGAYPIQENKRIPHLFHLGAFLGFSHPQTFIGSATGFHSHGGRHPVDDYK